MRGGVSTTCQILVGWESHADIRASDCGACGNTSSSSSTSSGSGSSTNSDSSGARTGSDTLSTDTSRYSKLCTKETSTQVYTICTGNNRSCDSGYTTKGTYTTQNKCVVAANSWLDQFRKVTEDSAKNLENLLKYYDSTWTRCVKGTDLEIVCTANASCDDDAYATGTYTSSKLCMQAAQSWLKEQEIDKIKIGVSKDDLRIDGGGINFSITNSEVR